MADFTGFTFNGVHSKELGLTRVSGGNRYERNLFPQFKAQTVEIPGADGTYFFGGQYTQRQFTINVAFDNLKETQLRRMQQLFSMKQDGKLIFDEYPYKEYSVYVTQSPNFKEICFGTDGTGTEYGERVYKGEATIQFVAYQPYAESVFKSINIKDSSAFVPGGTDELGPHELHIVPDESLDMGGFSYVNSGPIYQDVAYKSVKWPNFQGWFPASGLLTTDTVYEPNAEIGSEGIKLDVFDSTTSTFNLYNPGDKDTPFILKLYSAPSSIQLFHYGTNEVIEQLVFDGSKLEKEEILVINTKTHLIEVQKLGDDTKYHFNRYYNEHITQGDFFTIPQTDIVTNDGARISIDFNSLYTLKINQTSEASTPELYYKYLYL